MMNIKHIKINYLTYLCIILFLYSGYKDYILNFIIVFIFHELGHIFFCILFKIEIESIEVFPIGGVIKLNKPINYSLKKDLLISTGGFLFQILLSLINIFIVKSEMLGYFNKFFLIFNLIPIFPLDGSKVVRLFLSKVFSYYYSLVFSYLLNLVFIFFYVIVSIKCNSFNYVFFSYVLVVFFVEIKSFKFCFNKFLLERCIHNFNFKKTKKYHKTSVKKLKKNVYAIFNDFIYKNEKDLLRKKFDICT